MKSIAPPMSTSFLHKHCFKFHSFYLKRSIVFGKAGEGEWFMYYILNASYKDAIRYLKKSNASYEDATCPLIFGPDLLGLKLKFQIIAIKTVIL